MAREAIQSEFVLAPESDPGSRIGGCGDPPRLKKGKVMRSYAHNGREENIGGVVYLSWRKPRTIGLSSAFLFHLAFSNCSPLPNA